MSCREGQEGQVMVGRRQQEQGVERSGATGAGIGGAGGGGSLAGGLLDGGRRGREWRGRGKRLHKQSLRSSLFGECMSPIASPVPNKMTENLNP